MNVAIWVAQVLLAVSFLVSGGMKLLRPRLQLQAQLPYVEEFTDRQVKTIGGLEVLAAIGLIIPSVLRGSAPSERRGGSRPGLAHNWGDRDPCAAGRSRFSPLNQLRPAGAGAGRGVGQIRSLSPLNRISD